ncbi:MAG: ribonuclease R [Candidatus Marinimicrobia bacterium]|nr:ribonuclease R [Candidatus Neomarinimicrobiota bacterium]
MKDHGKKILLHFRKFPKSHLKIKQLAKTLNVGQNDYPDFRDAMKQLAHEGKLYRYKGNVYGLIDQRGEVIGTLDMHPRGFAYVHTVDGGKIFISEHNIETACHGDTVAVIVHRKRLSDKNQEGHVKRVVSRGKDAFVCTFHQLRGYDLAIPAIHHLQTDIVIDDLNGLSPNEGDYIMTKVREWRKGGERHRGEIISIIGKDSVPEFDAIIVANKYNIPDKFSDLTIKQVEEIEFEIPDDPGRKDLRNIVCFTIDPDDARDFDDAVSIEILEEGNYILGVHIADVSYYVPESTPLDRDALHRGTSVYFTDHVVHMLPEKLSTELCSLKPNTDRLAMTAMMTVTSEGKVLKYEIFPSLIHSKRRFTYKEVQNILDDKSGDHYRELSLMSQLAKILKQKRKDEGSIDFDLPEPVYNLDNKGVPATIELRERLWSHHIVEEFMLLANQTVANFARTRGTSAPFIYRIHDIPEADSIYEWFALMDAFGLNISFFGMPITSKKFQKTIEKVMKQNDSSYIMRLALRTMTKAKYSVKPIGHFGLAFQDYTHFTSPIRRYPDLMVHRLIKLYLKGPSLNSELKQNLKHIAKTSSAAELRALQAEREYHKIKQMRYITNHIGDVFQGIISGVSPHGFWVELENIFVEGFVRKDSLSSDIWDFDKRHHKLTGLRSKQIYRMGDKLNVRVVKVDVKKGKADFEVVTGD